MSGMDISLTTWIRCVDLSVLILRDLALEHSTGVSPCALLTNLQLKAVIVSVATRACMIVSDAVVIVVTWLKTWSTVRMAKRLRVNMSFTSLILKEGILYFT